MQVVLNSDLRKFVCLYELQINLFSSKILAPILTSPLRVSVPLYWFYSSRNSVKSIAHKLSKTIQFKVESISEEETIWIHSYIVSSSSAEQMKEQLIIETWKENNNGTHSSIWRSYWKHSSCNCVVSSSSCSIPCTRYLKWVKSNDMIALEWSPKN